MFWLLMHKDEDSNYWLYVVKAHTIDRACAMTGLRKEDISHCSLTHDAFDHLNDVDGGYIRIEF